MKIADKILSELPIFRHLTRAEVDSLKSIGALSRVKKGSSVDLKKLNTFNVVINGLFEIEALGKTDIVYLAPGSFFGHIPFTGISLKGRVRAMLDTTMIIFKPDDIYRFFIANYGAMRGYINTISRMGLALSGAASEYAANRARVISVTSAVSGAGVSTAAAAVSSSLAGRGRTAVIDLSYTGKSVFDCFDRKITAPFSHRRDNEPVNEDFISDRIVSVHEKLDIMNLSFSSKVKVDPALLSPLMFVLSKRYDYIVFDVSPSDPGLCSEAMKLSDYIVNVRKSRGDDSAALPYNNLSGIKTVLSLVNSFYEKTLRISGGYLLDKISIPEGSNLGDVACESIDPMIDRIARKKRGLVVESNYLNSVFLTGFFAALSAEGDPFDLIHTSSMSCIPAALYTVSNGADEFKRAALSAYGDGGFEKYLSIDFPENHIFRKGGLQKFTRGLFGDNRIESYKTRLSASLTADPADTPYIAGAGMIREIAAASLAIAPLFEGTPVNGLISSSGYPESRVRPEDLLRTDADEIFYLTVDNSLDIIPGPRMPAILNKYLTRIEKSRALDKFSDISDGCFNLEVSEKEFRVEKIMEITMEKSIKLLKDKRLFS